MVSGPHVWKPSLQANTAQHQAQKPRLQGRSLCKPSPGPMQLFLSGKNTGSPPTYMNRLCDWLLQTIKDNKTIEM